MGELTDKLKEVFPEIEPLEDPWVETVGVPATLLPQVVQELRDKHGFNLLNCLTAVDYIDQGAIEVVYHLMKVPEAEEIRIKVKVDRDRPEVPSLADRWPAANVQEREVYDLMGVIFTGHPNLKRILCPDDFSGHPLRKDFQLKSAGGGE
ncbi:MAG TPA: NADH-quinone oxidoreductase subunit C [Moorella mulderi]|nr:NADH-quinone oxidoreductase subunit C [Moorella mulderi]